LLDLLKLRSRLDVTTLGAEHFGSWYVPDLEQVRVSRGEHDRAFRACVERADDVWIIAPETDDRLAALTEVAEALGKRVIGSPVCAVREVSDKAVLAGRLAAAGVRVPPTWPAEDAEEAVRAAGFPLVVKPACGAGCEGTWFARHAKELELGLKIAERAGGRALVQGYVQGKPASASMLCLGGQAVALSLNEQRIGPARPFVYHGGSVPLRHPQADAALAAARRACEAVPNLRGYVGVDLVLADDGPYVIEINPRLTTSYVGLRDATDVNIAGLVLGAIESGRLPEPPSLERTVHFRASGGTEVLAT
ncbi:MAG: ATP-grasp domain-containing protein, partial [Gemmatimonadota bacterium]